MKEKVTRPKYRDAAYVDLLNEVSTLNDQLDVSITFGFVTCSLWLSCLNKLERHLGKTSN